MEYPNSYFEDEVISGFYVDARMKCCWAAQIECLLVIDKICRKHNIQYFVEYGSLLGTVRHGGFIPWDDDLDISMKRYDYELFLKVAKNELPPGYNLMNYKEVDGYYDVMTRVLNDELPRFDDEFLEKFHNMPYISGIDIFPMDYLARDKSLVDSQKEMINFIKSVADLEGHKKDYFTDESLEAALKEIERITHQKIDRNGKLKEQLYKLVCNLYAIYDEKESDQVGMMALYVENGGSMYSKSYFADSIRMPFDRITVPVPIGYDSILRSKYGDYMRSVRKGGTHDYPHFEKQMNYIEELGIENKRYCYSPFPGNRHKLPTFTEKINAKISVLHKIHDSLVTLLGLQDAENSMKLLAEAQNVAVAIGNAIEKKAGEETSIVPYLSAYCDVVYEVYSVLESGNMLPGAQIKELLEEALGMAVNEFNNYHFKKEIIFMPDRSTHWKAFESVWRKLKDDPENIVRVVPLPYNYKKCFGRKLTPMQDDRDEFPDYVDITPCDEYSLEDNHPDVIYIQNPHDQWNYSVMIQPDFFCEQLWGSCEKLIYIPWFKIDELNADDARGLKSREYFVPTPGVVIADEVILQSQKMKESYIDYLVNWAGEDTREIWEEKLLPLGSPLDDYDETAEAKKLLPPEWADKKLLLYHVSGNGLQEYKHSMIRKIEKTLKLFEASADKIQVLWVQDYGIKERLKTRAPQILHDYEQILNRVKNKPYIKIYAAEDEAFPLKVTDAYYGDPGRLAQVVKQNHKPVMLANSEIE